MDLKETLKTEIQEGKHNTLLGIISLTAFTAGAYAASSVVHKIKSKKEIDRANWEGFLKGYQLGGKVNKILERDEKK